MMDDIKTVGGVIIAGLVALALAVPKMLNMLKLDRIDGNVLERLERVEKKLHEHAIELTQVQMMLVQAVEHMEHHETPVPAKLASYVDALKKKLEIAT